jgi:hypothetical protein
MLTLFTFPKKPLDEMNKRELLKTINYLKLPANNVKKAHLRQIVENLDYNRKLVFDAKRTQVQYNGYCYYVNLDWCYKSFTVTRETDKYIYGDMLDAYIGNKYEVIYDKNSDAWTRYIDNTKCYNSLMEELGFAKIREVLYVIQYQCIITNMYYLCNNNIIMPDIYFYMISLVKDTFTRNRFVIL